MFRTFSEIKVFTEAINILGFSQRKARVVQEVSALCLSPLNRCGSNVHGSHVS